LLTKSENATQALDWLEHSTNRGELVREAKASLGSLQAAAQPGGEVAVLQALGVIMLDRPPNKREDHMKKLTQLMVSELKDFPIEAIREGAMDVLRDSSIYGFPTLAQLRDKVNVRAATIRAALWRARKIAEYVPPAPPPSPEERQRVKEMMADFMSQLRGSGQVDKRNRTS
jgi:hypothetical protein